MSRRLALVEMNKAEAARAKAYIAVEQARSTYAAALAEEDGFRVGDSFTWGLGKQQRTDTIERIMFISEMSYGLEHVSKTGTMRRTFRTEALRWKERNQ